MAAMFFFFYLPFCVLWSADQWLSNGARLACRINVSSTSQVFRKKCLRDYNAKKDRRSRFTHFYLKYFSSENIKIKM